MNLNLGCTHCGYDNKVCPLLATNECRRDMPQVAPLGTISQNAPDERPTPYESDTYNKGADDTLQCPDSREICSKYRLLVLNHSGYSCSTCGIPVKYKGDIDNPKRKPKLKAVSYYPSYSPLLFADVLYFIVGIVIVTAIVALLALMVSGKGSDIEPDPCDKYAEYTLQETPMRCVGYFYE